MPLYAVVRGEPLPLVVVRVSGDREHLAGFHRAVAFGHSRIHRWSAKDRRWLSWATTIPSENVLRPATAEDCRRFHFTEAKED